MKKDEMIKEMKAEIPKLVHRYSSVLPLVKSYFKAAFGVIMEKVNFTPEEEAAQKISNSAFMKFVDELPNILTDERFIEAAAEFAGKVEELSKPQLEENEDDFELPN
jgi:hypothetical protein